MVPTTTPTLIPTPTLTLTLTRHEGIERPLLSELLEYYDAHLACIVTPAGEMGEGEEEEVGGPRAG